MVDWPVIDQIDKLNDVDAVEAVSAGTEANRPASPNVKLLYISRDTGRVDYWNGSSWDPVGLSEPEIQLGDLDSKAHSELSSSPEDAHHSKDHDHTEADISQVPNAGLANDTITVAGNPVSLGGSVSVSIADLSDAALSNATSPGQIPIWNGTNSQFENAEISGGNAIGVSTGDASTTIAVNSNSIGSTELVSDSVTVAGKTVSLGGAIGVDLADLGTAPHSALDDAPTDAHHNRDHDHTEAGIGPIPNTGLVNDSVTIASTTIALGGSSTFGLSELSDLDAGSQNITSVADPNNAQDVATKSYADSVASGLEVKDSVRVATDGSDIDLTGGTFGGSIDGVSLSDGDRVLIKDQATASENGIYDYDSGTNTFSRSSDFDSDSDVTAGSFTFVEEGTNNQDNGFVVTSDDPISVGTDAINFGQFSGAGQITAGTGLNKSGDTLSVDEPNVDHDNLGGFVANEHIDHSGVTITGGVGLSGGGDLTTSRTIDMDIPGMTSLSASPEADDQFAVYDASAGSHKEVAYTEIESGLNHDNLSGYVANEHIDHSGVSISAGTGLSGGGDITTSRTLAVDADTGINVSSNGVAFDSASIKENGSLEIDAAEFAGDSGTADEFLQTDGASLSWYDLFASQNAWTAEQDLSSGAFIFPVATGPSPTVEGKAIWDSDDDVLRIGSGGATVTLDPSGGGSAIILDLDSDGNNESSGLGEISSDRDVNAFGNRVLSEPNNDEARFDMGVQWPGAQEFFIDEIRGGATVSELEFPNFTRSEFNRYILWMEKLEVDTGGVSMYMRVSNDGGSTYLTGTVYEGTWWKLHQGGTSQRINNNETRFDFTDKGGSVIDDTSAYHGRVDIYAPEDGGDTFMEYYGLYERNKNSDIVWVNGVKCYQDFHQIDTLKLYLSSGSFDGYEVYMYGKPANPHIP